MLMFSSSPSETSFMISSYMSLKQVNGHFDLRICVSQMFQKDIFLVYEYELL